MLCIVLRNCHGVRIKMACQAILFATFCLVSATASSRALSCEGAGDERTALKQAPSGARRVNHHVLEVGFKSGAKRFTDKAPHEALSGLHWRYCGYDGHAKVHLVEMTKESLRSGELLYEDTGTLLRAGHTILFSPKQHEFLAIEQKDGMDGELWTVYDIDGTAKWSGYAGTLKRLNGIDTVVSSFERPQWNTQGELTARCADSKANGFVTLQHSSNGWRWRGNGTCGL